MRAVVYKGKDKVAVEEVSDPKIEMPTDAIVKVTTAAICGSDLHMYEDRSSAKPGCVFGHENMGVVEEIGPGVTSIKKGDRVVLPFNIACGFCFNCTRGYTSACLTMNPKVAGAGYGYADMGPYRGGQAEYLRVPYVDFNALKLPGTPGDQHEDDFVLLADIFPTGWHAAVLAGVKSGDSVGIFGAGPVGLLAAHSCFLMGAAEVYLVDRAPDRLQRAQKIGAVPIDFSKGDPVKQIKEHRKSNKQLQEALREGEREKLTGVNCAIDAVGYQAQSGQDPKKEDPMQTIKWATQVLNPTGGLGLIGVYFPGDPGGPDEKAKQGIYEVPLGELWTKGISIGQGQAPVKKYNAYLRDLIIAGRAKPDFIVSHRLPLSEAPHAYEQFDKRGVDGGEAWTKVLLKPELDRASKAA
ncbi:MAG: glutathione-independent formaldehyde dehydrogenase [Acidobacteriaceae bacterium]|nr:glutathione-independent formaldehyde dehydrogenase [Acidobacteriaceae bacterium]